MKHRTLRTQVVLLTAALMLILTTRVASAHQPYFEDRDFTPRTPGTVQDPTVSTALYGTIGSTCDIDYVNFKGKKGQGVLVGLTIPQIEGQAEFAPTLALIGPKLPSTILPPEVVTPRGMGAIVLEPSREKPPVFYEPFSRTKYWERQEKVVTLPADGHYTVAIWNEKAQPGRYTLVIGDRELLGGDPAFAFKLRKYWTPVKADETACIGDD